MAESSLLSKIIGWGSELASPPLFSCFFPPPGQVLFSQLPPSLFQAWPHAGRLFSAATTPEDQGLFHFDSFYRRDLLSPPSHPVPFIPLINPRCFEPPPVLCLPPPGTSSSSAFFFLHAVVVCVTRPPPPFTTNTSFFLLFFLSDSGVFFQLCTWSPPQPQSPYFACPDVIFIPLFWTTMGGASFFFKFFPPLLTGLSAGASFSHLL